MNLVVEYVAPVFSHSGFGEAARLYIRALLRAGVEVTIAAARYGGAAPDPSWEPFEKLVGRTDVTPDVRICHNNPAAGAPYAVKFAREFGGKTVLLTAWETSRLPKVCVDNLNTPEIAEVWVPTCWNMEVFMDSGVEKPLRVFGHPYDPADYVLPTDWDDNPDDDGDLYRFYWIGNWSERKNPLGALRAYFHAFPSKDHPVQLVMKTIGVSGCEQDIDRIRKVMALPSYPPVHLVNEPDWPREKVTQLHRAGNCLIALSRGEGWNLPAFEACAWGNRVVLTDCGGHGWADHFGQAVQIASVETPCCTDPHASLHTGEQAWAEPDLIRAAIAMRWFEEARDDKARCGPIVGLTMEDVGSAMRAALEDLA